MGDYIKYSNGDCTMITLQEIKEFAEKEKACDTQLIPFLKFLNEGDELSC